VPHRFVIGAGYALYQGPSTGGGIHRHAAFQVAAGDDVSIVDAAGSCHRGAALVVPPMVPHRMLETTDLRTFFIEPRCAFADRLREHRGVTAVPELRDLRAEDIHARPSTQLDPRLVTVMDTLAHKKVPMPDLAEGVGLSPQRLRALARRQLGMPLASWRIWHCLGRAAQALTAGQSLADAALAGGFADQAHLTRRMREMMGLTPAVVLPLLRPQSRRAT
jgi:AraC-like DNA-binding protein